MQADLDPLLIPGASNVWHGFSDLVRLDTGSNAASNRPILFDVNTNGRLFVGPRGATPKRSNFNRYWQQALTGAGIAVDPDIGLHLHDLRHVGNDLRSPCASIRDLMAHMGHSTHNAALVYQHADIQRQQAMAAKLSDAIEQAIWPTSGPATSNVSRKAKRPARP